MKSSGSFPLLVSIVLLCAFGMLSLIGLPAAFVPHDYGELTQAARSGSIVGACMGVLVCFGLAYAQWSTRGRWGLGIALFALTLFVMQSFLMYLAVSSGRVSLTKEAIARFVAFTVIGALALAISSAISYVRRPKKTA